MPLNIVSVGAQILASLSFLVIEDPQASILPLRSSISAFIVLIVLRYFMSRHSNKVIISFISQFACLHASNFLWML